MTRETQTTKRERHNCTDAGNAARLVALMRKQTIYWPNKIARFLPGIIRAEAAEARAQLLTVQPLNAETCREWADLAEKTITLEQWATQCEYASTQEAALAIFKTMMTKEPTP
jgi:hypothetical protein